MSLKESRGKEKEHAMNSLRERNAKLESFVEDWTTLFLEFHDVMVKCLQGSTSTARGTRRVEEITKRSVLLSRRHKDEDDEHISAGEDSLIDLSAAGT